MNGFVIFNGTCTIISLITYAKTDDIMLLVPIILGAALTGCVYDNKTK